MSREIMYLGQKIVCDCLPSKIIEFLNYCLKNDHIGFAMECNKQSDNPILKNCAVHYNGDIIDTFSDQELLVIREQLNNNLGRELPAYSKKRHSTNNRYNYCASSEYNVELLDGVYTIHIIRQEYRVNYDFYEDDLSPDDIVFIRIIIKAKLVSIEKEESPLDRLMKLADNHDFKTAIQCIPETLREAVQQLQTCQDKMEEIEAAQELLETIVDDAVSDAKDASISALDAWKESAGFFGRKEAIEKLQSAGVQVGQALVKSTDIYLDIIKSQSALLDAQAQQLHYQKLLMDLSKGLLLIGSYNQQTNQALYQELKKQLSEASEKEIGELGMRELQSVAAQLKERQDMLTRMDAMEKKLAELTEIVNKLAK